MASNVSIVNKALNHLGATNISSLDEATKAGRHMNQIFETVRDDVFRAHPWNSLIRRLELGQETEKPSFGYNFQYALPTDPYCLRVLEFSNGSQTYPYDNMVDNSGGPVFVIEGRKLLTDETSVKIKYIARVTDPNEYDANLISTLAARLAQDACYAITGSTSLIQVMAAMYQDRLKEARFIDATEGASQRIEASNFIEARF
tara:strand:+ start:6700 stop:7305 length:606 start_codon:yes stop_codon:yes gene_type:complete